eukprot:UN03089
MIRYGNNWMLSNDDLIPTDPVCVRNDDWTPPFCRDGKFPQGLAIGIDRCKVACAARPKCKAIAMSHPTRGTAAECYLAGVVNDQDNPLMTHGNWDFYDIDEVCEPECTDNCVSTPGWTIDSNPVTTCGWMEHICGPMRRGECLEHGGNVKCQWGYVTGNHWANYGPYGSPVSHCCNCKGFQMPENYADSYWTTAPASWVWNGNWKNTHTSTGTELPICDPTNAPTETPTPSPTSAPTETPTLSPTNAPTETPTSSPVECTNNCVSTPGWTIDSNPVTTCGWMEHICGPMRRGECLEHGGNVKCQWGYVTGNHWANYGPYGSPVSHCCNCKGFQMPENYADGYWTTAPASWVWNGNWKNTHTSTGTELPICEPTNAPTETPTSSPVELDTLPDLKFYLKVEDYTSGNAWVDRVSNIEVHVPGSASFHEGYVHLSGTAITAPLQTNPNVMQSATYVIRLRVPTIPSNLGWVMSQFPDFGWSRALTISDDRLGHVWQTPGHFQSGLGSFPTDTWQVLVGTWTQGGACQTFLQGTSGNPRTCSNGAGTVSNEKLIIGGRGETDAHNPGSIDISDVLVFNRILNTDEINFITSTLSEPKTLPGTQVHDAL